MKTFPEKLKFLMAGRSQQRMSEGVGVAPAVLSHFLMGLSRPSADVAVKLGRYFHCDLQWLLDDEFDEKKAQLSELRRLRLRILSLEKTIANVLDELNKV